MMATCKECFHYEACGGWVDNPNYVLSSARACGHFKDKTKYVEQKHGRWVDRGQLLEMSLHRWSCTACGETVEMFPDAIHNYCPNCGAKMDEECDKNV